MIDPKYVTREYLMKVVPLVQDRIKKLSDIYDYDYFFNDDIPEYDVSLLLGCITERLRQVIAAQNVRY